MLLGHTLDDQAETVLLGLTRGSRRPVAGRACAAAFDVLRRPLLDLTRAQTEAACRAEGIEWWSDPHNDGPALHPVPGAAAGAAGARGSELGPGIAAALARTADQLREDSEALDEHREAGPRAGGDAGCGRLRAPRGLPRRRAAAGAAAAALEAGCPPSELFRVHVLALADLVEGHEGAVRPSRSSCPATSPPYREGDLLKFRRPLWAG